MVRFVYLDATAHWSRSTFIVLLVKFKFAPGHQFLETFTYRPIPLIIAPNDRLRVHTSPATSSTFRTHQRGDSAPAVYYNAHFLGQYTRIIVRSGVCCEKNERESTDESVYKVSRNATA